MYIRDIHGNISLTMVIIEHLNGSGLHRNRHGKVKLKEAATVDIL